MPLQAATSPGAQTKWLQRVSAKATPFKTSAGTSNSRAADSNRAGYPVRSSAGAADVIPRTRHEARARHDLNRVRKITSAIDWRDRPSDSRRGSSLKDTGPCGRKENRRGIGAGGGWLGGKLKSAVFLACQANSKRGTKSMKRQKSVNWMKDLRNAARSRDKMSTILADERGTSSSLLRQIKSLSNAPGWTV